MLRALLALALPARAEDRKVAVTFLGGGKKTPIEGLKVTLRGSPGDWTADPTNKVADGKTGKDGSVGFTLKDGSYYVDIDSDKELPYLGLPVGYKGHPHLSRHAKGEARRLLQGHSHLRQHGCAARSVRSCTPSPRARTLSSRGGGETSPSARGRPTNWHALRRGAACNLSTSSAHRLPPVTPPRLSRS